MASKIATRAEGETAAAFKHRYNLAYRAANRTSLAEKQRERWEADKDAMRASMREWYRKNRDAKRAYNARYAAENAEYTKARNAKWNQENKDHIAEYRIANSERYRQQRRNWWEKNGDAARRKNSEWSANNPDKNSARVARRKAKKKAACPAWADMAAIEAVYREASRLQRETGIPHHVDHIVPLQNEMVCGLHVHWNLRAIPAVENMRKKNRLIEWPLTQSETLSPTP